MEYSVFVSFRAQTAIVRARSDTYEESHYDEPTD